MKEKHAKFLDQMAAERYANNLKASEWDVTLSCEDGKIWKVDAKATPYTKFEPRKCK